jgi:hypothetical protein
LFKSISTYADHPTLSKRGRLAVLVWVHSCRQSQHVIVDRRDGLKVRRQGTESIAHLNNRGVEQGNQSPLQIDIYDVRQYEVIEYIAIWDVSRSIEPNKGRLRNGDLGLSDLCEEGRVNKDGVLFVRRVVG